MARYNDVYGIESYKEKVRQQKEREEKTAMILEQIAKEIKNLGSR